MSTYTILPSPIDDLMLVSDGTSLTGIYMEPHQGGPSIADGWRRDDSLPLFRAAAAQLSAYFAGKLRNFELPLSTEGTPFQNHVWEGLRAIPYGKTVSYGEFAATLGNPKASRAVGLANGRNPISIVIPCHRVIGANGKLVGYGGGLPRKKILLDLEANAHRGGTLDFGE